MGARQAQRLRARLGRLFSWCIESREHAEARGAKPYARLTNVVADLAQRKQPGAVTKSLEALWSKLGMPATTAPDHRRDRRRAGDVGGEGLPAASTPASRCAPPERRSATRWRPSFRWAWRWRRFRSRAARCFRPTIRPGSRLKCRSRRPRLWSSEPVTGRAKAWPWSRPSSRDGAGSTGTS